MLIVFCSDCLDLHAMIRVVGIGTVYNYCSRDSAISAVEMIYHIGISDLIPFLCDKIIVFCLA